MPYEPTPREALLIWRLIAAETEAEREPMLSATRPKFTKRQCQALLAAKYVALEKRKRSIHLVLGDAAWNWAENAADVAILKSRSSVGAEALQGVIRRLLPLLSQQEIRLAMLFPGHAPAAPAFRVSPAVTVSNGVEPLAARIEAVCLALGAGERKKRVRLSALRRELASVERTALDAALLRLSDKGKLVLYRDDNTAAVTPEDDAAAVMVGGAPRHLVYWE